MIIKKAFLIFFTVLFFSTNSLAAGSSGSDSGSDGGSSKIKSNYDKAVMLIKSAKKYEKKK